MLRFLNRNQEAEIANNFHGFPENITRPYLEQMKRLFRERLGKALGTQLPDSSLQPFHDTCIEQLEDLCEQITEYQEKQAQHPYTLKLDELVDPDHPFVKFLLFQHTGLLSAMLESGVFEDIDDMEVACYFTGLDPDTLTRYSALIQQPVSSWSEKEQKQKALAEEYWERRQGMQEYDDAPMEVA